MVERKRYAGGVLDGRVTLGYRDDWQREGLIDAPARVVWLYELLPGSSRPGAPASFLRWIFLDGRWEYVPYLDTMLDASFTTLMVDAARAAGHSCERRSPSSGRV